MDFFMKTYAAILALLAASTGYYIYLEDEASILRYIKAQATDPGQIKSFNETKLLAEKGDPKAQFDLGFKYAHGHGVVMDELQAATWYRKAADQGHTDAQCFIGIAYSKGEGVPKDLVQAAFWYRRAAEHGHDAALALLAECYLNGEGVPKDLVQAYAYFNLPGWGRRRADELEKKMSVDQVADGQKLSRQLQSEIDARKDRK